MKIACLPGDGIGQEVMAAVLPILSLLDLPVTVELGEIGWEAFKKYGNPIPEHTWSLIKASDAVLLGATTSQALRETQAIHSGTYVSPIIQLRQGLDLYANVRPCWNLFSKEADFHFCIIRENTEGLYSGLDYYPLPDWSETILQSEPRWQGMKKHDLSLTLRVQSRHGLLRIFEYAFQYAVDNGYDHVTFADKPNVLRNSSAFARELFESVAKQYSSLQADILNVDAVALWLVKKPEKFGVIVAENMFADVLSDLGAGVMGGLGLAPSANIGEQGNYFEPVHGSGLKMQSGTANPSAMFLTVAMLLDHFHFNAVAFLVRKAVQTVIQQGKILTYDLGGSASTEAMAQAILLCFEHLLEK